MSEEMTISIEFRANGGGLIGWGHLQRRIKRDEVFFHLTWVFFQLSSRLLPRVVGRNIFSIYFHGGEKKNGVLVYAFTALSVHSFHSFFTERRKEGIGC